MKLKLKFLLGFFSLALLLGAPLWITVKITVNHILLEDLERRGILRASDIAETSIAGFDAHSEQMLLPALQTAQARTGAVFAAALSPTGEILAHTNVAEKGRTYREPAILEALQASTPVSRLAEEADRRHSSLDIFVPVWAVSNSNAAEEFLLGGATEKPEKIRLGTVQLRLPLKEIAETQLKLNQKIAVILLLTGLIAMVLILLFMRRILLRIQTLSAATSRIRQGEYGKTIPVTSKDELGELADDFNRMIKTLAETTVSKDYFSGVLEHLADPLIVTSADTMIQDANPAALTMLGYTKADVLGKPLVFLCQDAAPLVAPENQDQFRRSTLRNLEVQFRAKNGQVIPALLSSSVHKDPAGTIVDIIVTVRDMTERKRLEGIVRQTDKMSAVGQLAAGVAHEINNPLGVILGFVETMEQDLEKTSPLAEPMQAVIRETLRCKNLVQNLLAFSRERKPGMRPEEPVAVVESALSLVETQARVRNVVVVRDFKTPLSNVSMDRNQIEQVIINLCTNAMDAMSDGGTLTVGLSQAESWLEMGVSDTGTGIASDIQQRIFEPFFSTKEIGKGTGLGLSLVYDTVKKHQGTIEVQSEKGHGAQFIVRLPLELGSGAGGLVE
jgi:PAS domain S-box-containing protein